MKGRKQEELLDTGRRLGEVKDWKKHLEQYEGESMSEIVESKKATENLALSLEAYITVLRKACKGETVDEKELLWREAELLAYCRYYLLKRSEVLQLAKEKVAL